MRPSTGGLQASFYSPFVLFTFQLTAIRARMVYLADHPLRMTLQRKINLRIGSTMPTPFPFPCSMIESLRNMRAPPITLELSVLPQDLLTCCPSYARRVQ